MSGTVSGSCTRENKIVGVMNCSQPEEDSIDDHQVEENRQWEEVAIFGYCGLQRSQGI